MTKLHVHVGSPEDMGRRFVDAFKRGRAGQDVNERHVTFLSLQAMMAALTPKRLELLRHLRREPAGSIKALATALGRDYKRVHEDVTLLENTGLLTRQEGRLSAPWDALAAEVAL